MPACSTHDIEGSRRPAVVDSGSAKNPYHTGLLFEEDREAEAAEQAELAERTAKFRRRQEYLEAQRKIRLRKLRYWSIGVAAVLVLTMGFLGWANVWPFSWRATPPTPKQAQETALAWLANAVEQVESYRKAHGALPPALSDVGIGPPDVFSYYTLPDGVYRITVRYMAESVSFESSKDPAKFLQETARHLKRGKV
jgi:hypothetical protein